jgi:CheY-like chemotaxis protein
MSHAQPVTMSVPVHVLLVEDEPLTALVTASALRELPDVAKVTIAVDGADALDRLRSGAIAHDRLVILTDLNMPRMTGLELLDELKKIPSLRDKPVAVMTTSTDPADREAALAHRVAGYFIKTGRGYLDSLRAWLRNLGAGPTPSPAAA